MRLQLLPADKGDCFLVTSRDGKHLLVDGGMGSSFRTYVAPRLAKLHRIDRVLVTHIDADHIAGILELMNGILEWRVYDYQHRTGNRRYREPDVPKAPRIGGIWHNAFGAQVGDDRGEIAQALVATAALLSGAKAPDLRSLAEEHRELATSVADALRLVHRLSPEQLDIPVNAEYGGDLMLVANRQPRLRIGRMRATVIGPFQEDLARLEQQWDRWLKEQKAALEKIERESRRDADRLRPTEVEAVLEPLLEQARALGDRAKVTVPNLASLMVLLEEDGATALLTGDGHGADVLAGLDQAKRLDRDGRIHVNLLKVQHHGSEHNIDEEFCDAVTADHYVFCANGAHENPDLRVVEAIVRSRLRAGDRRPFTLWFNSGSAVTESPKNKAHMRKVERLVTTLSKAAGRRMRVRYRTKADGQVAIAV